MNKKQLKKIRRAKLLKKKHNIWKNEQNLPIFDMTDPNTIWDILK